MQSRSSVQSEYKMKVRKQAGRNESHPQNVGMPQLSVMAAKVMAGSGDGWSWQDEESN